MTGAVIRSCAPQLAAHYDRTLGIELYINQSNLANQLDIAGAGLLMARQRRN